MSARVEKPAGSDEFGGGPALLAELELSERLMVWAFRCWIAPTSLRGYIVREFTRRFGARDCEPALQEFVRFVEALHGQTERVLHFHHPCCPCVGRDEMVILGLLASAQSGDNEGSRAAAFALTGSNRISALLSASRVLSARMADNDLFLPARHASKVAVMAVNDNAQRPWLQ
ncbi:MAG TPA: hypothetical protein VHA10_04075 [Hypericibacter adhaerens]|jgi:hypothetical protein|uniref:Uncharacterized protein n=1 Tax=Hypericibacter adhaerens TaxID=2602016 RepID=A0A5J6N544_9PROT|nr:hypothetical protein [Hypericibacter adhaerens]QEX24547.1 hypothetical protein FRZ61_44880 [Hypericibacter adhaerens]HWA42363.1 hypothetical protein [Hypericibacter adhaerens]